MNPNQLSEYRELKDWSVEVDKTNSIEFNSGSETSTHVLAKVIVGHLGVTNGYRVSSEVRCPKGEIDVVLFGHPDRLSYAVELEHSPTAEVKESKLERYVLSTPLDELCLININNLPKDRFEAVAWVADQLGLEP